MDHAPLIVTLELHPMHQPFFNGLRKAHFPAHANYLDAHITLFHHLPSNEPCIYETLTVLSKQTPFTLKVNGLHRFENGVAYTLASDILQTLHQSMQEKWKAWLVWRDQQPLWPHITIQNKVTAFKSQQLHEKLGAAFVPFEVAAVGITTWLYLNGPWERVAYFPFTSQEKEIPTQNQQ
ncbi:2'-5' RNA ligase superfamily protein [Chitinophaga niastensis]|uniref:2'-5' RNA ligase superfamily protein n=1 Tax=Chitinophaga niastensis TaxID=536980 RepID=A0A2P8HHB9_CHINA|nr:2'-5' RNA ligase family protein [Chitinophaga niastensis]PSL45622.1 2'-5' RNA ligase superfamily protein [Chitinophaga niastensis]